MSTLDPFNAKLQVGKLYIKSFGQTLQGKTTPVARWSF